MSEGYPHHSQPTSTQLNILVILFPTFSSAPMSPLHLRCLLPLQRLGQTILLPTPSTALIPIPALPSTTPTPRLDHFIAYALHRTHLHPSVTFAALYLLQCLKDAPIIPSLQAHS
jgi:hypothetical protein